jgi:cytochrome c553
MKDASTNLLRDSIAALRGTRSIAYRIDMSQSLRSVRLALKPLATVFRGVLEKTLFLMLLATSTAQAAPFAKGHADNGKKLFARYECSTCHEGKVGGDGSAIFTRKNRRVTSASNLVDQIERCSGAIGAQLSEQEKQDLAAHLNQTYYKFK